MEQSTAIRDLPFKKNAQPDMPQEQNPIANPMAIAGQGPPPPINTGGDAAARFAQMPQGGGNIPNGSLQKPVLQNGQIPKPEGIGQGISGPFKKKEFFGLADFDYKSTIVVFALILIFSSSIFFDLIKKWIPLVQSEGKTTLVGSLVGALAGAIIFLVIKILAKF